MLTVGIDLAAEPLKTGLATLKWSSGGAEVLDIVVGADDDVLIESVTLADKVGIDCPLGWPVRFVDFVTAHDVGSVVVPDGSSGIVWRRALAYRETDLIVHEATGRRPLSVSADRIAHTAMRAAGLLSRLAAQGEPVDRTGTGLVVEVYPAASLRHWGLPSTGYKSRNRLVELSALVDGLLTCAPWLSLGAFERLCRVSDDATDAVVAALTARASALGLASTPSSDQLAVARREGWIAVPTSELGALRGE